MYQLYIIGLMTTLAATELRIRGSDAINRVAYAGDRVLLQRHGKSIAAIVSVEDLELLQALEDRIDLAAARKALKSGGRVAWDKIKADLNLQG
jgi:prevent-host-death family protein